MNPVKLHERAVLAATAAQNAFLQEHGDPMYCGFAWSTLPDGRSSFTKALVAAGVARKGYDGYRIWSPGGYNGQSMSVKEAGAQAYSDTLTANGIKSYLQSRAD